MNRNLWFTGKENVTILNKVGQVVGYLRLPSEFHKAPKCVIPSMVQNYILLLYLRHRGVVISTTNGEYIKTVSNLQLADITEYKNIIYGLDYVDMRIHVYQHNQNSILVYDTRFQKSRGTYVPYGSGHFLDNLRVTKYHWYISSFSGHRLFISKRVLDYYESNDYRSYGKYEKSCGYINPGWLNHPILTSVDNNNKALIIDVCNNRIQVFVPSTGEWAVLVQHMELHYRRQVEKVMEFLVLMIFLEKTMTAI